jgi:hypothetical protein
VPKTGKHTEIEGFRRDFPGKLGETPAART